MSDPALTSESSAPMLTTDEIVSRLRAMPSPTRLAAAERLEQLTVDLHRRAASNEFLEAARIVERDGLRAEIDRLTAERDALRTALSQIANGDGYYGAQAREYKQIARAALAGQPAPAAVDERDTAHG